MLYFSIYIEFKFSMPKFAKCNCSKENNKYLSTPRFNTFRDILLTNFYSDPLKGAYFNEGGQLGQEVGIFDEESIYEIYKC